MDSRVLFIVLIIFSSAISSSSSSSEIAVKEDAEKVKLTVYYESLCPYCENFIVNYLVDVFEGGIDSIVDVKLFPYGNAKIRSNGTITCQHGPRECLLNTIEACAIHVWPDVKNHFPFVLCVETAVYRHRFDDWATCFKKLHLDPKPVTDCYNSGYGNKLELQYAAETNALEPPHKYVPWVVVDGQPLYDDYIYIVEYVCRAYKGRTLPRACLRCLESSQGRIRTPKDSAYPINPVTYRDGDATKSVLSRIKSAMASWMSQLDMEA